MEHIRIAIEDHGDAVWSTVWRLLNDHEDARDCYQQTFLEALQIDPLTVRCWKALLIRIATTRALDRLRQRYREPQQFSDLRQEPTVPDSPDQRLLESESLQLIRTALASLPDLQAEVFWLRHAEQLSPKEIAAQLNIDAGHIRVLVHRAIVEIRRLLEQNDRTNTKSFF